MPDKPAWPKSAIARTPIIALFLQCLNATQKSEKERSNLPSQLCSDWVLYERVEVQVCITVPVWHHGIVGIHCDCVHHYALVVAGKGVEFIHGLGKVYWLVHHHGVVHPRCLLHHWKVHGTAVHESRRDHGRFLLDGW
jgi:hypothetical protein